ncbi:hypothetical protein ACFWP7_28805 [Streptomyces sp. NPDC058470]|uniref:hypothetical protein n=1 Tax=Streptomyces sp. NPDC058470 TaxID=3346515 RepID=UPI00365FCC67
MPSLPPKLWAELFFDDAWNPVTRDLRQTSAVSITRGLSSESSGAAGPVTGSCDLGNRSLRYAPRNVSSDLFNKIGRNTPMRLGYRVGSPWMAVDGTIDNGLFTPDAAALDVTGDFDLRVDIALDDWSQSQMIAARYETTSTNNRCWALEILDGVPTFLWSTDGTLAARLDVDATEAIEAYNGQRMALRVTLDVNNGASGHEVRFYTGRTVDDEEWTLLGLPVTGVGTTSVFGGTAVLEFGSGDDFNADPAGGAIARMTGKGFALKLLNGIAGTVAVAMATANAGVGATSFTDSRGLVWSTRAGATLTNKHTRLVGEVPAWPPTRHLSGNDTYVSLEPSGVTRRMDAGNKPVDSALLRYLKTQAPVECWPLTDAGQSGTSGKSLTGGGNMRAQLTVGTDLPEWGSGTLADWVEPVITFKGETAGGLTGAVPNSAAAAAAWSVDFLYSSEAPGNTGVFEIRDRGAGTDANNLVYFQLSMDTNDNDITVFRASQGETSSSSSLILTGVGAGIYDGAMHHIRFSVDPGVADSTWEMFVDGASVGSGTLVGIVVKAVSKILYNWSLVSGGGISGGDQSIGYVTYWDSSGPTAADFWNAASGYPGERAGARIERLATEGGYTATVAGETAHQGLMGIQRRKKLLELMTEANKTNFGYLLESRDRNEVIHRGQSTLWNQPPAFTLDFSSGVISAPFRPDDGDKLTENDVSVQRDGGQVPSRQVLEEGSMSVLDPPDGVGRYDRSYTYSLYTDDQAGHVAGMRLHLGTYDGVRYARLTLDLANERVFQMIDSILWADVGDKIRLTNLPDDHGPDDVNVLINGYTEEAGPDSWKITFNCVPAEPWTAFVADSSTYGRADTSGSSLNSSATSTATSLSVATAAGNVVWVDSTGFAAEFPFDVRINGGEVVRVTAVSGTASPQTFTVVRGVNGVQVAHAASEDVRLAHPVYFSL